MGHMNCRPRNFRSDQNFFLMIKLEHPHPHIHLVPGRKSVPKICWAKSPGRKSLGRKFEPTIPWAESSGRKFLEPKVRAENSLGRKSGPKIPWTESSGRKFLGPKVRLPKMINYHVYLNVFEEEILIEILVNIFHIENLVKLSK
jgi:hypothetical protein